MRPFAPLLLVAGFAFGGTEAFAQGYVRNSGNGGTVGSVTQFVGGKETTTSGTGTTVVGTPSSGLRLQGSPVLGESSEAKLIAVPKAAQKPAAPEPPLALRGVTTETEPKKAEPPREAPSDAAKREAETKVAQADVRPATRAARRPGPRKPFEALASATQAGEVIGRADGSPFEELN